MSNGILVLYAADYRSFHINCGGQDVKNGKILYEGDQDSGSNAAARCYNRSGSNWGFSSTGDFMDDENFYDNRYTLQSNSNISLVDFGLYATGIQVQKDFNFTEEAKGSNRNFTIAFNTTVTDRTLEIRLYWAGKGTTSIPRRGNYGPIISAISATELIVKVRIELCYSGRVSLQR
ncbi:probable LRR receptor-like serine/threonine-protein kinase At1g29720 [Populus nigra]|uniref:probable LRR receptor-like serine/threonine-protein kinase At1g29720 n=1 Tax=Populus nigra TaxID=3691 RepID=UPI002B267C53|nr:probable LRR receptor-like serine/threonine-protein kinase At1g29720 [Populus nigra]